MKKFLENVYNYICEHDLLQSNDKLVVGVSGGADSVCLLRVLCELAPRLGTEVGNLFVVHINHGVRGTEADEDQSFVEELCQSLGVWEQSFFYDVPAFAKEQGISTEEAGRILRYQTFSNVAKEQGCNKIVVAHNQNDLAETVIFNMLRGSGIYGLGGIAAKRENVVRPLLDCSRKEIEEYLQQVGQEYRNDSTNATCDYTRNIIRHKLLPIMEEVNEKAINHICQLSEEAKSNRAFIDAETEHILQTLNYKLKDFDTFVEYDIDKVLRAPEILQMQIIQNGIYKVAGKKKDITRKHFRSVHGLLYAESGKYVELPYGVTARRSFGSLIIERKTKSLDESKEIVLRSTNNEIKIDMKETSVYEILNQGNLEVSLIDISNEEDTCLERLIEASKKTYTKILDYDKIKGTLYKKQHFEDKNFENRLLLRTPRENDYIIINQEGQHKKLSRVFIDNKIDRELREQWPVVAINDEIIWAVGLRFNELYRVSEGTHTILKMIYNKNSI